jgi:hypothetical protein
MNEKMVKTIVGLGFLYLGWRCLPDDTRRALLGDKKPDVIDAEARHA